MFAHLYAFSEAGSFNKAISLAGVSERMSGGAALAIGREGRAGLAVLLDASGAPLWSRRYGRKHFTIDFHDGCLIGRATGRVGIVVLAAPGDGVARPHLLVRLDLAGNIVWARLLGAGASRSARVVASQHAGGVLVIGRTRSKDGEDVELIRVADNGAVIAAASFTLGEKTEIVDALAAPGGYRLIGRVGLAPLLGGAVVTIDDALKTVDGVFLNGAHEVQSFAPSAACDGDKGALVIAAQVGRDPTQSAIVNVTKDCLHLTNNTAHAYAYAITNGHDDPGPLARLATDYLVFERSLGAGAQQAIMRFDAAFSQVSLHALDAVGGMIARDFSTGIDGRVYVPGDYAAQQAPFMLQLETNFASCRTDLRGDRKVTPFNVTVSKAPVSLRRGRIVGRAVALTADARTPVQRSLCGGAIAAKGEQMVQSPFLLLQAAGSTGVDASRGVLLRWHLLGKLGETHLPMGNLQTASTFFNKLDDFVTIYRAPWPGHAFTRVLNLAGDTPLHVDAAKALHVYQTGAGAMTTTFYVSFLNPGAYAAAAAGFNPKTQAEGFLKAYGAEPIEVEIRDVLALRCDLTITTDNANPSTRVETLSVGEPGPLANKVVTSRRIITQTAASLLAENMRAVRCAASGGVVTELAFLCYEDVLSDYNQRSQWTELGRFALSLDRPTVCARLETPSLYPVNGVWRKFNDGAFVNIANYTTRWQAPSVGVEAAVQNYVSLSATDPLAEATFQGSVPEDGVVSFSYLDLLQIAGLDFHLARMLGLGCIDASTPAESVYVYLAEYLTKADLGDGSGARDVRHLYMSLPTSVATQRMPPPPELLAAQYGLSVPTANGPPYWLTDASGYTPDGSARYVRLIANCKELYEQTLAFFTPTTLFDMSQMTLPVFYGVEYRKAGDAQWRRPEIASDASHLDTAGRAETTPSPFPPALGAAPFVHKETEAGVHEYGAYAVNILARASPLSNVVATDATKFTKPNRLLPPSDLRVQLIQPEGPLLLTTQNEQAMLTPLQGGDDTLVRVTFNYAQVEEENYSFATGFELFFRETPPRNVIGGVKSVADLNDPTLLQVETQPYVYLSTLQTVTPSLDPADKPNFVGGVLVVAQTRLIVVDIQWPNSGSNDNPIFILRKPSATGAAGTGAGAAIVVQNTTPQINVGELFMAVENMAAAASWGALNPLAASVDIDASAWTTQTESYTDAAGIAVSRTLRGLWKNAKIEEDPVGSRQYTITFPGFTLAPHAQTNAANPVSWHKGVLRAQIAGAPVGERRSLEVLSIDKTAPLTLIARDDSGKPTKIAEGQSLLVNYYPGYKVYVYADPAHGLNRSAILPAAGEGSRMSIVGARSVDAATTDAQNAPYRSQLGTPQLLLAQEIIQPQKPNQPAGLDYATPPDNDGKSSYTLNLSFPGTPYAFIVCRADALSILRKLYTPTTLALVRAKILPPKDGAFFKERFADLFDFANYPATLSFRPFALEDGENFELPHPDAPLFAGDAANTLDTLKDTIKAAILKAFVSLTEQPLIHHLIRTDPAYAPTNAPQVFRDANRDILAPGAPGFDLAPMAVRPNASSADVRFVDFTLDGSMNPDTVYFYLAYEIGSRMDMGKASPVWGPVKLINTAPPLPPALRKITSAPYDPLTQANPEVRLEFMAPAGADPIARVRLYRADNAPDATHVRTMRLINEIALATLPVSGEGTCTVVDNFAGESFIPYGEPLFYRLAFVREAPYRDAQQNLKMAFGVSPPTRIFLTNVVDAIPPEPPVPVVESADLQLDGKKLVTLGWNKTVHNGRYHVCRLSAAGVWIRVGSIASNAAQVVFQFPEALPQTDEENAPVYHRFCVDVTNSSNIANTRRAAITVNLQTP